MILIAAVILWTMLAVNKGCRHLYYLQPSEQVYAMRLEFIITPFAVMALGTGKISVAFLILRIMGQSTWRRRLLYFSIISTFIFCGLAVIFTYIHCIPVQALWDPSVEAKCWKPETQSDFNLFVGSKSD